MNSVFDTYAAFYDALYREKCYTREVDFVRTMIESSKNCPRTLLDLGCGTGAHALEFVKAGYEVVGIDLSASMIHRAKLRAEQEAGLSRPTFQIGDARTTRLDRTFDVVTSLFHVASYHISNSDLVALFNTASTHLQSGGRFLFDFWHGPGVLKQLPETRIKRLKTDECSFMRIAEPEMDFSKNTATINYTIYAENESGSREIVEEKHIMRYLFIPEIEYLLKQSGFSILHACPWMEPEKPLGQDWLACILAEKM